MQRLRQRWLVGAAIINTTKGHPMPELFSLVKHPVRAPRGVWPALRMALVVASMMMITKGANAVHVWQDSLENGMKLVVIQDTRAPVVLHSVWYRAGSMDEPAGQTGIAHMLEHLMFKGTEKVPAGEFDKIVQRKGGEMNAFTSRDYTAYYEKTALEHLPLMMELEADRMANLRLSEEDFVPERAVVAEERQQRVEARPVSRFFEKLIAFCMFAQQ